MADTKISALTAATTPLAGTEVLPIVQSGTTKKVSIDNLTAGRSVSVSELAVGVATPTAGYKTDLRGRTRIGGADGYLFDLQSSASNGTTLQAYLDNGEIAVVQGGTAAVPVNFFVAGSKRFELLTTGNVKASTGNLVIGTAGKGIDFTANGGVIWRCGSGTPEGAVTAPVGSLYTRTDGGANTTLYVKESGTGSTGWVAK